MDTQKTATPLPERLPGGYSALEEKAFYAIATSELPQRSSGYSQFCSSTGSPGRGLLGRHTGPSSLRCTQCPHTSHPCLGSGRAIGQSPGQGGNILRCLLQLHTTLISCFAVTVLILFPESSFPFALTHRHNRSTCE